MLAISDRDGVVSCSIPGLAHIARVSEIDCRRALSILGQPDPDSRSKEFRGRRITPLEDGGGWVILSYKRHRDMLSEQERNEYKAMWIRSKRKHAKEQLRDSTVNTVHPGVHRGTTGGTTGTPSTPSRDYIIKTDEDPDAQADADAKAEAYAEAEGNRQQCQQKMINDGQHLSTWSAGLSDIQQSEQEGGEEDEW